MQIKLTLMRIGTHMLYANCLWQRERDKTLYSYLWRKYFAKIKFRLSNLKKYSIFKNTINST